jgi:hypothetical protein
MRRVLHLVVFPLARRWRWVPVAAGIAALVATPAFVASRPVTAPGPGATTLLARVVASEPTRYEGTVDTLGRIPLPDLGALEEPIGLLGERNRLRVWFEGPTRYRVDQLSLFGEIGTYVGPEGTWRWESERRAASATDVPDGYRAPRALDLTPPELGRRLARAATPGDVLSDLPPARVAGRAVPGLRIRPAAGTATTVDRVDLWADPVTGTVLRVEVRRAGASQPSVASAFRELSLGSVDPTALTWRPADGIRRRAGGSFDPVALAAALPGAALPRVIAGVGRSDDERGPVGLFGDGFDGVVVAALDRRTLPRGFESALPATTRPWGGTARVLSLGLVNVVAVDVVGTVFVLTGAVPIERLDAFAAELATGAGGPR